MTEGRGRHKWGGHDFFFTTSPITRCRTEVAVVASEPPTTQAAFGLIYNYVLSKRVSGRPEASITPPCLFTPFHTRFIPADGLFTVGDPCAASASHKAKRRRRLLQNKKTRTKSKLRIAMEPTGAVQNYTRLLIHSVKCGY